MVVVGAIDFFVFEFVVIVPLPQLPVGDHFFFVNVPIVVVVVVVKESTKKPATATFWW